MLEVLKDFDQIVVTGPQRSGTTICARIIAHDCGHRFVAEEGFGIWNMVKLQAMLAQGGRVVIQAPGISRWCDELPDNVMVVWMIRPLADILVSQKRIGWAYEDAEARKYGGTDQKPIAQVKLDFWREHQRPNVSAWVEVNYNHLADHPLWVPREQRAGFGPRQTEAGA